MQYSPAGHGQAALPLHAGRTGQAAHVPLAQYSPAVQGQLLLQDGAVGQSRQPVPEQYWPVVHVEVQPDWPQAGQPAQVPLLQNWPAGHAGQPATPQAGSAGQAVHWLPTQPSPDGQPPQFTVFPQALR